MSKLKLTIFTLACLTTTTIGYAWINELLPFFSPAPLFQTPSESDLTLTETTAQELESSLPKITRPKTYQEYLNRAKSLSQNNFPTLAISEFLNAQKLNPTGIQPLIEIAKIYINLEEFNQAKLTLLNAKQIQPESSEILILLAKTTIRENGINLTNQNFAEAINIAQNYLLQANQSLPEVQFLQATLHAYKEDFTKTKQLLSSAKQQNLPQELKNQIESLEQAMNTINETSDGKPIYFRALLAKSFLTSNLPELAIPTLIQITKEQASYRDSWILLGYANLQLKKYREAISALERARNLDPIKSETLFYLGLSYYYIEDYNQAINFLESAKNNQFEPKQLLIQTLAQVYLSAKNYQKAAEQFEASAIISNTPTAYLNPIWLYLEKTSQPEKALLLSEKIVKQFPEDLLAKNLLAWSNIENKKFKQAEKLLSKLITESPNYPMTHLNIGRLYESTGKFKQALKYYEQATNYGNGNAIGLTASIRYNRLQNRFSNQNNLFMTNITN